MSLKKADIFSPSGEKNTNSGFPGGSSLMVIFAILCLTVFAILSLSTVLADGRLSDANAAAVKEYYEASNKIEEEIAQLRMGEIPEDAIFENGVYTLNCAFGSGKTLTVKVKLKNSDYEILSRTVEYTGEWNADNSLNVWSGE